MSDTTFFGQTFSTTITCVLFLAQIIETLSSFKNMLLVSDKPWKRILKEKKGVTKISIMVKKKWCSLTFKVL